MHIGIRVHMHIHTHAHLHVQTHIFILYFVIRVCCLDNSLTVRNELRVLVGSFKDLHLVADFEPRLVFIDAPSHFALGLMLFEHFLNSDSKT